MLRLYSPMGLIMVAVLSCHESKYLGESQTLYTANKTKVESSVPMTKKEQNQWSEEMEGYLRPTLNSKILGLRVKLWIYNIAGTTNKKRGLKHWLKYKVGEPPVLASPAILHNNAEVLQNHFENKGFFHDTVLVTTVVKDKHLTATYTAQIGPRYRIGKIDYPDDSDQVSNLIDTLQRHSLLKSGNFYDFETIKEERVRIDNRLKNRGYYYFSPDDLLVDLDTAAGNNKVDMFMRLKDEMPDPARDVYHIDSITAYVNYASNRDTSRRHTYITPEGYHIIDPDGFLRPHVFSRTLLIRPEQMYKDTDYSTSLSRLVSLGVFQFVKARFDPASTADTNSRLNLYYYLTPTQKKQLRFEVTALTRSDNTTGTELALNWRHKNLFRGAELFNIRLYSGIEGQSIAKNVTSLTRRAGIDMSSHFSKNPCTDQPEHQWKVRSANKNRSRL